MIYTIQQDGTTTWLNSRERNGAIAVVVQSLDALSLEKKVADSSASPTPLTFAENMVRVWERL